jgi:hypothetical protein
MHDRTAERHRRHLARMNRSTKRYNGRRYLRALIELETTR